MLFWTFFFYRLKQQNLAGNFPVSSRPFGQSNATWCLQATSPTFAYTLQRFLSCTGKCFLWMSPRTESTFQQPAELSKHQIAHQAQTSHLLHSLIFNSRGSDLTDFYCTFLPCHTAAFSQLSALPASSASHLQLNNIDLIWNHSLETSVSIHISHTCFSLLSTPRRYKVPRHSIIRSRGILVGLLLPSPDFMAIWSHEL